MRAATTPPPISVAINTSSATVRVQATRQFSAHVVNSTNQTISWRVNGVTGGNATIGTITTAGMYTAPAIVPSPNTVTVAAVSAADPTKNVTAAVQVLNLVPQLTALIPPKVNTGLKFSMTVTGSNFTPKAVVTLDDNTAVTITSRSSTQLTFSGTSMSVPGTNVRVVVTNPNPGAANSQALVFLVISPISVSVNHKTATIRGLTSATFTGSISNALDKSLAWSVNGVPGGNATLGTITANGVYTAPVLVPASVTIAVTSGADPTKSAAAAVTLQNPWPVITSAPASITAGTSATLNIAGTGFAQGAQVKLAGASLSVKWNSPTSLTATSGVVQSPSGGIVGLQVINPNPGAIGSNVVGISVPNTGTKLKYAAAHRFLEQATWGSTPASIAHLQSIGIDAWLTEQFDTSKTPISTYSPAVDTTSNLSSLQAQFFAHALTGPDQLRQRVAFALGQIAVVSGLKLTNYDTMVEYQQLLLNDAFGKYSQFIKDVTLSPGMGHYLDMVNNSLATATTSPNENYARELMQLFTIGLMPLNPDGTAPAGSAPIYTQDDITAIARVLTGWTYPACSGTSKWANPPCFHGPMVVFENHHDNTAKEVLGTTIQTGSAEGDLDLALTTIENYRGPNQTIPNIAPFISKNLIQHLVTSNPSPAYVTRVSTVFAQSGGDLKQVVKGILEDTEAGYGNGGAALPNDQGHLREPVLYAVSILRSLGATLTTATSLNSSTNAMGQDLFNSPSVFNYYSPFYTLPTTAILAPEFETLNEASAFSRANYASYAAHNQVSPNISIDVSNFITMASDTSTATQTTSLTTLLNAVSQTLLGTPMSSGMLNAIMPAMLATQDPVIRAHNAVYLVAASPQYQVVR
ncbi:MAG TPA: DUF1800 domain-containing protein [Bryobacteraceae bacterium]|jgi:uncharacterized protein (DUF1800 family)|nr:DUF1800 domain-containing protein [Bryobacteraceae bacterium]